MQRENHQKLTVFFQKSNLAANFAAHKHPQNLAHLTRKQSTQLSFRIKQLNRKVADIRFEQICQASPRKILQIHF